MKSFTGHKLFGKVEDPEFLLFRAFSLSASGVGGSRELEFTTFSHKKKPLEFSAF